MWLAACRLARGGEAAAFEEQNWAGYAFAAAEDRPRGLAIVRGLADPVRRQQLLRGAVDAAGWMSAAGHRDRAAAARTFICLVDGVRSASWISPRRMNRRCLVVGPYPVSMWRKAEWHHHPVAAVDTGLTAARTRLRFAARAPR
jgi:hypothetical protein